MSIRKTKIVCTIGPASEDEATLRSLICQGMNVARMNMSHGTHEEHLKRIQDVRRLAEEEDRNVSVMLDTKGPEIRTGRLGTPTIDLKAGDILELTTQDILGNAHRLSVSYAGLTTEVLAGDIILLDDGLITLKVIKVEPELITTLVENDGRIAAGRGVNVPGKKMEMPFLSEKDHEDILFAMENGVDFIALSFVQSKNDILKVRELLDRHESGIKLIAKIENISAVDNIKSIIKASDAVMIARGDLGVEVSFAEIPLIQKKIIRYCYERATPVITATQMLDSMIRHPRPTRAEVADVANAVLDGTDCVMLSGETAAGDYPLASFLAMEDIVRQAETMMNWSRDQYKTRKYKSHHPITDNISLAAVSIAGKLKASALIVPTRSGFTPRMVAKYRPNTLVVAVVSNETTKRYMSMVWGVEVVEIPEPRDTDSMIEQANQSTLEHGYVEKGDITVITAGVPVGVSGKTNLLKVQIV